MQDKKPDIPVSDDSNLVIVTTPEYVKESIKEAIAEHAASRNHPDATLQDKGFVVLSNDTGSDSETMAATPKAVKAAYDLANTANQNALNNNPALYLEKKQNGADIPDKAEFVKNIGLNDALQTGDFGIGGPGITIEPGQTVEDFAGKTGFYQRGSDPIPHDSPLNHAMKYLSIGPKMWATQLAFDAYSNNVWIRSRESQFNHTFRNWNQFSILGTNTFMDANGNFKLSSSIINLWSDGQFETNNESKGATVERTSKGIYFIKGVMGLNADGAWGSIDNGIEIPLCKNKLPLIWVDHKVLPDGSIKLMTYHREHSDAPAFARNIREGYADGDLIDIPDGRFVSVRVQMPDTK